MKMTFKLSFGTKGSKKIAKIDKDLRAGKITLTEAIKKIEAIKIKLVELPS